MEKHKNFVKDISTSLAIKAVILALKNAQKEFIDEYQTFRFLEGDESDLLHKKFEIIIGDSRPHVSTYILNLTLKIKIINSESLITEVVDGINLYWDEKKVKEEQDSSIPGYVMDHIEKIIVSVFENCTNK